MHNACAAARDQKWKKISFWCWRWRRCEVVVFSFAGKSRKYSCKKRSAERTRFTSNTFGVTARFPQNAAVVWWIRCWLHNCDGRKCWRRCLILIYLTNIIRIIVIVLAIPRHRCHTILLTIAVLFATVGRAAAVVIIINRIISTNRQIIVIGQWNILIVFGVQQIGWIQFNSIIIAWWLQNNNRIVFRWLFRRWRIGYRYHMYGIIIVSLFPEKRSIKQMFLVNKMCFYKWYTEMRT